MQILIEIPQWFEDFLDSSRHSSQATIQFCRETISRTYQFLLYQHNALWFLFSLVVFWPVWVYFAVAITTAWAWAFWLFASALLGIVQVGYVSYQFVMISLDVMVLTSLKTYQVVMRSWFVNMFFGFFSRRVRRWRQRTSRRRHWKRACEACKCYGDFKKVNLLEPKASSSEESEETNPSESKISRRERGTKRSHSVGNLPALEEERSADSPSPTKESSYLHRSLTRIGSFNAGQSSSPIQQAQSFTDSQISQDLGSMTADLLTSTTERLREARHLYNYGGDQSLLYLLSGVVKRNHLALEDLSVNNGRSVAYSGQHEFSEPTRELMEDYYDEVSKGIYAMAEAPVSTDGNPLEELGGRINLIRKMKHNTGRTALMLSGGGAQAMYHLGTVRALIDGGLYDDIKVVSGTSGGSITAAMCALRTSKELFDEVCVNTVSTDYQLTGEMKKRNIRWFPPVMDMVSYWLKHKLLVDSALFRETCEFYYSDTTFAEAFARTGKHVCITVSASRATGGSAQRLLLNHISTPHVTLASAVAASCALPGVMKPAKLQTKDIHGNLEPFEVDGVEWIDGSVQADLPFQRISTLFNVSNYVVAQTNFHVVPFLNKSHHPNKRSLYWRLFQTMEWDIRNRALKLSRLGLFPRIFGQDMSKVFKQKYHGNLTLVPRFTAMQTFGLKALVNPTVREMDGYLKYGQIAAWPFLSVIKDMIRLESALDECLARLKERCHELKTDDVDWATDDLDSIASSTTSVHQTQLQPTSNKPRIVRFARQDRECERLRVKLSKIEQENVDLKQQVQRMEALLVQNGFTNVRLPKKDEEKKQDDKERGVPDTVELTEGGVWNLVNQLGFSDSKS